MKYIIFNDDDERKREREIRRKNSYEARDCVREKERERVIEKEERGK